MLRPLVYVAGPITSPDPMANAGRAIRLVNAMMDDGFVVPFCPHLSVAHQLVRPRNWEQWLAYDESVIQHCHALYRMDGESRGADREVDFVLNGSGGAGRIPVFHESEGFLALYRWAEVWAYDNQKPCPGCVEGCGQCQL